MNKPQLPPIGLAIRRLDKALTAYTDEVLATHNLSRSQWQTLNLIKDSASISFNGIFSKMHVFINEKALKTIIEDFLKTGWVKQFNGEFSLTDKGVEEHEKASKTQDTVRLKLTEGITEAEFEKVVSTLLKMTENIS